MSASNARLANTVPAIASVSWTAPRATSAQETLMQLQQAQPISARPVITAQAALLLRSIVSQELTRIVLVKVNVLHVPLDTSVTKVV